MTAYAIPNDNFRAACAYLCRESKDAKVLAAVGVRADSPEHLAEDFTFQRQLQPALGKAAFHIALSLRPADAEGRSPEQVSALLRSAGQAYLRALHKQIYKQEATAEPLATQWVLVQHVDRDHPHAHLLLNRVNDQGEVIPDTFIGQHSRRACQQVEAQLGLVTAEQEGRAQAQRPGPTNRQAAASTPSERRRANWQRARHTGASALLTHAEPSSGFPDLAAKLVPQGIQQIVSEHRQPDGSIRLGVRFVYGGYSFKGGDLGQQFTASQLEAGFARTRESTRMAIEEFNDLFEVGRLNALLKEGKKQADQRQTKAAVPLAAPMQQVPPVTRSLPLPSKNDEIEL